DMVAYTDKMVGKIVAKLEGLGLSENTLVLFLGDNGTDRPIVSMLNGREVAGGKGQTTDAGTHVPMIAYWPGTIRPGQVRTDLVDTTDFLPTICEAAGVDVPDDLAIDGRAIDGRSFLPQLLGKKGDPRQWIYCWYSKQGQPAQARQFARNARFKLYASGRFFDVANDPLEQNDLSGKTLDDEAARARETLQKVLDKYENARPEGLRSPRPGGRRNLSLTPPLGE
ncbi:MAG: sulfatase-like hydrolase/transferase, partial [Pirellulaceae bacterium]|nr:sulfatase-like hydrolase/transferase [Pirellulaceae bacterium]